MARASSTKSTCLQRPASGAGAGRSIYRWVANGILFLVSRMPFFLELKGFAPLHLIYLKYKRVTVQTRYDVDAIFWMLYLISFPNVHVVAAAHVARQS
jgi:hypothetical protein